MSFINIVLKVIFVGLPVGPVGKNLPANAEDTDSISGLGRFHMPQGQLGHVSQLLKPTHSRACTPQLLLYLATKEYHSENPANCH